MTILLNKNSILELLVTDSIIQNRNGNVKYGTTAKQVTHTRGNVYVPVPAALNQLYSTKHTPEDHFDEMQF